MEICKTNGLNGFLGAPNQRGELRTTKLEALEQLVDDLPILIANGNIRKKVETLTDLIWENDLQSLTKRQIEAAFRIYTFLLQSYVRGNSHDPIISVLPENFSKQLTFLSKIIGCEPIINYAATVTFNWQFLPGEGNNLPEIRMENLKMISLFTGSVDESWFYIVSAAVDSFSPRIIELAHKKDDSIFVELSVIISKLTNTLKRMYDANMPEYFYNKLRRFMSGWVEDPELPEGVLYTFPDGEQRGLFLGGASAAQSPTIHLLDIILDISHPNDTFLTEMRSYMPREHREVLEYFEKQYKGKKSELSRLKGYTESVEAIKRFRQVHFDMVKNYILRFGDVHGTGGSNPASLLKSLINDTKV